MSLARTGPRSRSATLRHRAVFALLACSASAAAACAHAGSRSAPPSTTAAGDSAASVRAAVAPVAVEIENRSSLDAIVYAVRGSIRQRLGTVPPVSRITAVIPASFIDDRGGVALYAYHLAGNTSFTSDRVVPQPGDRLVLTLQTRLSSSTLSIQ